MAVAVVVWLVREKKLLQLLIPRQEAPRLSPFEEAITQLDELERERLPENGSVKLYYSRLGDIFRMYLYRRMGIASLAETSEEIISQSCGAHLASRAPSFAELGRNLTDERFRQIRKVSAGIGLTANYITGSYALRSKS